jgi:MAPEG family
MIEIDLHVYGKAIFATTLYVALYYFFMIVHTVVKFRVKFAVKRAHEANKKKQQDAQKSLEAVPSKERRALNVHSRNDTRIAEHPDFIVADRTMLNMNEQMGVFLTSLWLYVLVVDADFGANLCFFYTACRLFYYPFYNKPLLLLPLVTFPNYFVTWYMAGAVALKALPFVDFSSILSFI